MDEITEKDFRSNITVPSTDELDVCFDIAFNIDEHLRKYNAEYRKVFPDIDAQEHKEFIADAMISAKTVLIKKMLTATKNSSDILRQLEEYEKNYPKNHYEIYSLNAEHYNSCPYTVDEQRANREYINRNMYEIIASVPMGSDKRPMQIETTELIKNSFTNNRYVPNIRDIIVINFNGVEKAYFREHKRYVEVPEFVGVHIRSAAISNYRGYTAFIGTDNNVYLGRSENYLHNKENGFLPFYNNTDNSLVFISDNQKMFSFLYGSGWSVSQQEMIKQGVFSINDYAEYENLNKGILSRFDKIREITFNDKPFDYAERKEKLSVKKQLKQPEKHQTPKANKKKTQDLEV